MDITKAKAAIAAAKNAIQELVASTVKAAEKNTDELKGLGDIVKANGFLSKAEERLDGAKERTAPKPKEEKPAAAKK